MTLQQVADQASVSFGFIGHLEHERYCPGLKVIERLRGVFGAALEKSGAIVVTEREQ
jgi:hypothetical protein